MLERPEIAQPGLDALIGDSLRVQLLVDVMAMPMPRTASMSPGRGPNPIRFNTCTIAAIVAAGRRRGLHRATGERGRDQQGHGILMPPDDLETAVMPG